MVMREGTFLMCARPNPGVKMAIRWWTRTISYPQQSSILASWSKLNWSDRAARRFGWPSRWTARQRIFIRFSFPNGSLCHCYLKSAKLWNKISSEFFRNDWPLFELCFDKIPPFSWKWYILCRSSCPLCLASSKLSVNITYCRHSGMFILWNN